MSSTKNKKITSLLYSRIVTIVSIMLTLTTLGIITLGFVVGQNMKENIKERLSFRLELSNNLNLEELEAVIAKIELEPYVRSTSLLTADSAAVELSNGRVEDNPIRVLGYNPLPHVLTLYLNRNYTHPDSLTKVKARLQQLDFTNSLNYTPELVESIEKNTHQGALFLWIFLAFQALVTYIQLGTTIRLRIYADRLRIQTLTLVGGRPSFIRSPFIRQAQVDALLASVLATALIAFGVYTMQSVWQVNLLSIVSTLSLLIIFLSLTFLTVVLSSIIAYSTTNKYIKMRGNKIYLI